MNNFFKKLLGIDKIEAATAAAVTQKIEAEAAAARAVADIEIAKKVEEERLEKEAADAIAKMTPKEKATAKGEAWVAVLDTHVNKDNIRNGFFELDWNEQFVLELKQAGYGYDGDPEEEIVDRWFRDLARNMLGDEGQDSSRGAGYINVVPITKNQSEVS